jgi:hypothetical protein
MHHIESTRLARSLRKFPRTAVLPFIRPDAIKYHPPSRYAQDLGDVLVGPAQATVGRVFVRIFLYPVEQSCRERVEVAVNHIGFSSVLNCAERVFDLSDSHGRHRCGLVLTELGVLVLFPVRRQYPPER